MAASVIAKLQHMLCHGEGGLAYVYCTYNERHTARDLPASILRQLTSQLPSIPQKVNELYTAHKVHRSSLQIRDLQGALIKVVSNFPKVFIAIDAVDECQDDKNRAELLEIIQGLKLHVNILVTSRHSGTIGDAFAEDAWLEIEASGKDIKTYVRSEIHKRDFVLSGELAGDLTLQSRITRAIASKAQGMFLHARFHVQYLATKHNLRDLQDALRDLPTSSNAIYQQAMQRMQSQNSDTVTLARKTLSWILCAMEISLSPHAFTSSKYLLSICAGLIIVDKETNIIRLVHYTAQEYLEAHTGGVLSACTG
ncbi:hypothetical protein BJX63DRAFT_422252 [Aspergillus granulosus]|uniref:Nephrocystin 3-like N-terminal domain-containing protein n=1 Tax=Aspergillus granulosus TaxID=176169 RepID=A0ABR4H8Z3_9EURO